MSKPRPFAQFDPLAPQPDALRTAIEALHLSPETVCVPPLIAAASFDAEPRMRIAASTKAIVEAIRADKATSPIEGLMQEYGLSSHEGVALMCLAESLLRVPDAATRDALIRDKVAPGDWAAHLGGGRSLFTTAATWGLLVTGKLTDSFNREDGLATALTRLVARGGEPVIRSGVDLAMRIMGEQFVLGQTIDQALSRSRTKIEEGFGHSYDMLGEAAMTAADAARYLADYERAIHAIGTSAKGKGPYREPGISIKLSALHPRYRRAQKGLVLAELLPRLAGLAQLAKGYNIGLNIDAEEADRLDLSLDLLEALCLDPALADWEGLGFVVQAYSKRCPAIIDFLIDLAQRSGHRLMVRLVKGAYWDSEIKIAQVEGLDGFPVYTRKIYSDIAYTACAAKLLAAPAEIFPQFATHNAQTVATILELGGPDFAIGQYEFQCLHGMGEKLYEQVVGPYSRPCRIYAPVGSHDTLLAYLVRRLLENGANSSFVNRIADEDVSIAELAADPVDLARAISPLGAPHPIIALPRAIHGASRVNSSGLDLSSETALRQLGQTLSQSAEMLWRAGPVDDATNGQVLAVHNPADHADLVGEVRTATDASIGAAFAKAALGAQTWAETAPAKRAEILLRAADLMQARMGMLMGLAIREAGKSAPNAIAEVREAIDFLRYYAAQIRDGFTAAERPLGIAVCISPWNFPLAIFIGQITAALAAGNAVMAKPAEETPLIAAQGVAILLEAGIPANVLHLLPGDGRIGAALVAHSATNAVLFTGSTEVARLIARQLAARTLPDGRPIPLIAETGGQNAMIVDSTALTEQVVADVVASAFDSAGQRCSALRILCLQEDIAERTLTMLKGAMAQLQIGNPDQLATDIGPVISHEAQQRLLDHIRAMAEKGLAVESLPLAEQTAAGTFVAPTIIELRQLADLPGEVFGPILHVFRYKRKHLGQTIDAINALGYGLTFGLHTRLDATIAAVSKQISVGNIYVNRNVIGAVVGVQPFGGHGLSGTGPKAGGPLYLRRLLQQGGRAPLAKTSPSPFALADAYADWLETKGYSDEAVQARAYLASSAFGTVLELAGPVGERNQYRLESRGAIALLPQTGTGLRIQLGAVLAADNSAQVVADAALQSALAGLPANIAAKVGFVPSLDVANGFAAALAEGDENHTKNIAQLLAVRDGIIVTLQSATSTGLRDGSQAYDMSLLVSEVSTSINTTAAGGNASLLAVI